jgi:hypothetical protein
MGIKLTAKFCGGKGKQRQTNRQCGKANVMQLEKKLVSVFEK